MTIKKALQVAIQEEIKAYNLYMETREKVTNSGTKAMLLDLADQELGHRKLLENIIHEENYLELGDNIQQESQAIAEFLVTSELNKNATPQDVMIFAMKEEEKAFNFYDYLKNNFMGTELENIFSRLAAEERGHKIKLEREYDEYILREN